MVFALLVATAETEEKVKPLAAHSLFVTLAIILVVVAAILLAGFGYFSPGEDNKHH